MNSLYEERNPETIRAIEQGVPLAELERRLKANAGAEHLASSYGFLGEDEDLVDLILEDFAAVKAIGLTHDQIALRIEEVGLSNSRRPEEPLSGSYWSVFEATCGAQRCPWGDGATDLEYYMFFLDGENPEHEVFLEKWRGAGGVLPNYTQFQRMFNGEPIIVVSGLMPHLIQQHKFFEGKKTVYRIDPTQVAKYMGLIAG